MEGRRADALAARTSSERHRDSCEQKVHFFLEVQKFGSMFRAGLHPNPSAGRGKHGACPRRRLIHLASLSVLPTCRVHSFSCLSCRGPSRQAVSKDEQAGHRTWASRGTDPTLQQRADGRTGAGAPEKISEPMEPWPKARPWRYLSTRRINWSFRGAVVKPALLDAAFTPRPRWRVSFGHKRLGS